MLLFFYPPNETPDADGSPHEDEVAQHHPVEDKDTGGPHDDAEKGAADEDGGEEDTEPSGSDSSDEEDEDDGEGEDLAPQTQNAFALLEEECP